MSRRCHQDLWLPSGHYVAEYEYWPADSGDRSHNAPTGGEVSVTKLTDMSTGYHVAEWQNPDLYAECARAIEERLSESEADRFF